MTAVGFCFIVMATVATAGCGPAPFDRVAEQQKLLQLDTEWADVASAGKDVDKAASYWADDAVVIPQGQPVAQGKAAIRAFVASSFAIPGFHIHWKSEPPEFSPDGKLAYMRGANDMTVSGPDGTPIKLPGRALTVWRKDADGQWRCIADIWNDPPRPADAAK
jgi:ketosteroid isomerase-like protein